MTDRFRTREEISELAVRAGHSDLEAYAAAHARDSWHELAKRLDPELVAVELQAALMDEAERRDTIQEFARASLVRYLNEHLPNGWTGGESPDFETAFCYGDWITSLGERLSDWAAAGWTALEELEPPRGWLPAGPDDPYLVDAFARPHGLDID